MSDNDRGSLIDWIYLISDLVQFAACVPVLIKVICIRKQKDCFLLAIPIIFTVQVALEIPIDIAEWQDEDKRGTVKYYTRETWFMRFCFIYTHWLFTSQYLQTSLVFPKLYIEAKLETIERAARPTTGHAAMQVKDIEDELTLIGHQTVNKNIVDTFKNVDAVVKAQRESVSKIKLWITAANVIMLAIGLILSVVSFPEGS